VRFRTAPQYRTGILSDAPAGTRAGTIKKFALDNGFDAVVRSREIKALKPDPRAFTRVLDALAVRPDRTVFVDNNPANIDGATALGMQSVLLTTAQETMAALKELLGADGED
jgi:HAD superfamily hydrolase (TIGR01509 family)